MATVHHSSAQGRTLHRVIGLNDKDGYVLIFAYVLLSAHLPSKSIQTQLEYTAKKLNLEMKITRGLFNIKISFVDPITRNHKIEYIQAQMFATPAALPKLFAINNDVLAGKLTISEAIGQFAAVIKEESTLSAYTWVLHTVFGSSMLLNLSNTPFALAALIPPVLKYLNIFTSSRYSLFANFWE